MNDSEVLHRQINPSWIDDGYPTSQGFRPTPKDQNRLSVDRSSIFTAKESYVLHTEIKQLRSVGTYGVSLEEFAGENIECAPDPISASEGAAANPAHAVADFSPHSAREQKNISKKLRNYAVVRGCLYPPAHDQPPTPSLGATGQSPD